MSALEIEKLGKLLELQDLPREVRLQLLVNLCSDGKNWHSSHVLEWELFKPGARL